MVCVIYFSFHLFPLTVTEGVEQGYDQHKKQGDPKDIDHGHLDPCGINTFDLKHMAATFTLTNSVPQYKTSNIGRWNGFEMKLATYAKDKCANKPEGGTLYVLTGSSNFGLKVSGVKGEGVIQEPFDEPSILPIERAKEPTGALLEMLKSKGMYTPARDPVRMVLPRSLWTAACCVWKSKEATEAESLAVMSNNHWQEDKLLQTEMSLKKLEQLLAPADGDPANLFPGNPKCRMED